MGFVTTLPRKPLSELDTEGSGLISQTFDRKAGLSSVTLTSQSIFAATLGIKAGKTITNIQAIVSIAASGTAPTLVKFALLDKTQKVLAVTADYSGNALLTTTGMKAFPLSPAYVTTADDIYYVAVLKNGAFSVTDVKLFGNTNLIVSGSSAAVGSGVGVAGTQTGQTDFQSVGVAQTLVNVTSVTWFGVS
jgi:hypothetical protein